MRAEGEERDSPPEPIFIVFASVLLLYCAGTL
jgi:hypothetical protein